MDRSAGSQKNPGGPGGARHCIFGFMVSFWMVYIVIIIFTVGLDSRASSTAVSRESSETSNRNRLSSMFIVDIV